MSSTNWKKKKKKSPQNKTTNELLVLPKASEVNSVQACHSQSQNMHYSTSVRRRACKYSTSEMWILTDEVHYPPPPPPPPGSPYSVTVKVSYPFPFPWWRLVGLFQRFQISHPLSWLCLKLEMKKYLNLQEERERLWVWERESERGGGGGGKLCIMFKCLPNHLLTLAPELKIHYIPEGQKTKWKHWPIWLMQQPAPGADAKLTNFKEI